MLEDLIIEEPESTVWGGRCKWRRKSSHFPQKLIWCSENKQSDGVLRRRNLQPNLANARLATLKKTVDKTYQKLEAEINELVFLAARRQKGDTKPWSITRTMEVFKTALNEKDRSLLYQENQSRRIARPHFVAGSGFPDQDNCGSKRISVRLGGGVLYPSRTLLYEGHKRCCCDNT